MQMQRFLVFFLFLGCMLSVQARDLLGVLEGDQKKKKKGVFTTTLPSLEGELRDFPNAVSVYNALIGSQDSLEFYPVPEQELDKYKEFGPKLYHASFMRRAIIDGRYKDTFNNVRIVSEELRNLDEMPLFITMIEVPGGSQIMDNEGNKKDLWVALGSTLQNDRIFIYQVAVTFFGKYVPDELPEKLKQKIIDWANKTSFKT